MGVNYGFEKVRFVAPVRSGARIRGRFVLKGLEHRAENEIMLRYAVTVEIEGGAKPALVAEWLSLAVFRGPNCHPGTAKRSPIPISADIDCMAARPVQPSSAEVYGFRALASRAPE
jgi:hypothetical protein